ncbi:sigma-70 family RNA polymerase sigma factor [Streptomyces sp. NPDC088124]|uniref:sigma-70 family RNA polymerase sigma factor n=1 Tax=Streptomyces sp. NPDC088124 TaxID=3154654 RepID=UPI003427D3AA
MSPTLYTPAGSDPARYESTGPTGDEAATGWALAARGGDLQAADRFVRALHLDVWRFVAHLSADPQSADDLTQDTFLRALGSLHGFEGRSSARTWLLTIARRTVIDSLRSASARPRRADGEDWQLAAERTQQRDLPGFDEGVALTELLSSLPRDRREAFVLTQLLGVPYAEVAVVCRCPVGTVRSRVSRARAALWELLDAAEHATDHPEAAGASSRRPAPGRGRQHPARNA